MAKVICDYCGTYIDDTLEKCPNCGGINAYYKRTSDGTPKTIEELKQWYEDHHLPDEKVTRFFIGKNVKEAKAFGIYREEDKYIVYKNKADGTRSVRYKGKDEAYAVNELFLRLKEEILNQKSNNTTRGSISKKAAKRKKALKVFMYFYAAIFALALLIPAIAFISYEIKESKYPKYMDYYVSDSRDLYYYEGNCYDYDDVTYRWWEYDKVAKDWNVYAVYDSRKIFPDGLDNKHRYNFVSDICEELNLEYDDISIYNSRNYIDAGHHYQPSSSYYRDAENTYYYLQDPHGSSYGTQDNSGWYIYDEDYGWSYFCDYDDRDMLPEEFWYYPDDYIIYDIYSYYDYDDINWDDISFYDTSYYQDKLAADEAYQEYWDNYEATHSSYDSDSSSSSWDWDSGSDSWDSGSTDWDSDW